MIEINLLPEELKPKAKKGRFAVNPEQALYLIAVIAGLLVFIHLVLASLFIVQAAQLKALKNRRHSLDPQIKALEKAKRELQAFSEDAKYLGGLAVKRINWSEKLNRISLDLPSGIWLNELSGSLNDFTLKCSVISLKKEEMSLINKFIDNLKNDAEFFKDFKAIELSSAQMRSIAGYDITDFILSGSLKK